jgi:hypothetical protein
MHTARTKARTAEVAVPLGSNKNKPWRQATRSLLVHKMKQNRRLEHVTIKPFVVLVTGINKNPPTQNASCLK